MAKLRLGINIDHVATLRNARNRDRDALPDLLRSAMEAVRGGADSITFHLREDRRHISDDDAQRLHQALKVPINLEMAVTEEMRKIALRLKPQAVCLVPENRREVTTEGGLDARSGGPKLKKIIADLQKAGMQVALFIDPDVEQVAAAKSSGALAVELHTGCYAGASAHTRQRELGRLKKAAKEAHRLGLEVHAGHGLNYANTADVAAIPEIVELNIGHFLVGEALFIGMQAAVKKMRGVMASGRKK